MAFIKEITERLLRRERGVFGKVAWLNALDRTLIVEMHHWGIPVLRCALGIVYLWFGVLKITGVTPVGELVAETYWFLPTSSFLIVLGWWEILIGLGLVSRKALRTTLALLWLQLAGTFFSILLSPRMFFLDGNPLILTVLGEFIVKNIVLTASGLVIGGYEIKKRNS